MPKDLVLFRDPLDGGAFIDAVVLVFCKNVHAAGGQQGLSALPIVVVVLISLGAGVPDVTLHRPHPGEVIPVQADDACLAVGKALIGPCGGVEQVLTAVLLKDGGAGPASGAVYDKGDAALCSVPAYDPQEQGVLAQVVVEVPGGQGKILRGALGVQQLALDGVWGEDGGVRGLEQGVQDGLGAPGLAALGGRHVGRCPALRLTGGQPAAGQNEDGEDWGQQGRALLFPRQDAADTRLGFPGGAGQRGGEGGAWDGFHKIAS